MYSVAKMVVKKEKVMSNNPNYPHGVCECDSGVVGGCCLGNGPAAFEVVRDGKIVRLCTQCDLSSDKDKKLLVTEDDNMDIFADHDALGGLVIVGMLEQNKL